MNAIPFPFFESSSDDQQEYIFGAAGNPTEEELGAVTTILALLYENNMKVEKPRDTNARDACWKHWHRLESGTARGSIWNQRAR